MADRTPQALPQSKEGTRMKALLRTELYTAGGLRLLGIFFGIGLLTPFLPPYFLMIYAAVVVLMLPLAAEFSAVLRMRSRFDCYALNLPYRRTQIVDARYVFYLLTAAVFSVWIFVLDKLFFVVHADFEAGFIRQEQSCVLLLIAALLTALAINLPFTVLAGRFGKPWMLSIGICLTYFGFIQFFLGFMILRYITETHPVPTAAETRNSALLLLLILTVSWLISRAAFCCGFKRKEASA